MELKNNGKINFVIDLFINFKDQMSGGLVALHKLAYELAVRGHNVYIFCQPEYPHENIHVIPSITEIKDSSFLSKWEGFSFNFSNTVSIYTEYNLGNPFGTKHIARWIIYHTKKECEDNFLDSEYYFNYGSFYTYKNKPSEKLVVFNYNLDKLFIENNKNRKGYCHILHKNTPKNYSNILNDFDSTEITNWFIKGGFDYLRKEFNKYEYFLTFDQKTFLTTAAALCGCKTIILNPDNKEETINAFSESKYYGQKITPLEYRLENPINMFGVAYGIEDLKWAEDTISLVRNHIIELEKIDKKTIDKFIDFWNEKCYI